MNDALQPESGGANGWEESPETNPRITRAEFATVGRRNTPLLPGEQDLVEREKQLIRRIVDGDEIALGELYDRFSAVLYSCAVRFVRDETLAEEVVQEVFVRIWEKATLYDPRAGRPLTWAMTLTRNKSIDACRSRQRRQRLAESLAGEMVENAVIHHAVENGLIDGETAAAVRSALKGLPEEQRQAIELAYFSGLTQAEIAEELNQPLGTIKARIRRGLMSLRSCLPEDGSCP